jgi:hypothetical protein
MFLEINLEAPPLYPPREGDVKRQSHKDLKLFDHPYSYEDVLEMDFMGRSS